MKKPFISIVITSILLSATAHSAHANDEGAINDNSSPYIGTGIGAVAGALFAGPVGFLAGGLIGNLAAKHDAMHSTVVDQPTASGEIQTQTETAVISAPVPEVETPPAIVVARTGEVESVIDNDVADPVATLKEIIATDLSVDVFFLSGSTSVETFYRPRMLAISRLMQQIPGLDIQLEGYSDRRGDRDSNLALSQQRLDSVRDELVQAGVDAGRIHMSAFGEQQFLSRPGELEAYAFDRRVVIRFEHSTPASKSPLASIASTPAP